MDDSRPMPKIECLCGCGKQFIAHTGWHVFYSAKCKHNYNRQMARLGKEHDAARQFPGQPTN